MVFCAQAQLAFSSGARRDAVLADVEARIVGRPRWDADVLQAESFRFGTHGIRVELRFVSRADADDLLARMEAFAVGQRLPEPGSWMTVHDCTHDEATNACLVVARRDW